MVTMCKGKGTTMKKGYSLKKWIWWFTLIAASIFVYKTTHNAQGFFSGIGDLIAIFTPFIIGFVITFLLYAPCNSLERVLKRSRFFLFSKGARFLSVAICYLLFLAVVTGLLVLLLPAFYNAIAAVIKALPGYYETISARIAAMTEPGGLLERLQLNDTLKAVYDGAYRMLLSLANPENILTAFRGILSVATSFLSVIMAIIVSVYMLAQRESLLRGVKSLIRVCISERAMSLLTTYAHKTARIFYKYLYGAMIDAAVIAVVMSVGFLLFGLPGAILLGCMVGLMNIIPYFGAIIGGCVAVLVALFTKNIYTAIGVAAYVIVMQQLDGNILQPRIVGGTVGIRPIYVLLAVTVGGGLFGFWGILLSVPVMAVILMLLHDFIDYRKQKKALDTLPEETT